MEMDFTQTPPKAKTLEEAQGIINLLWKFCGDLLKRVEEQQKTIVALQQEVAELKEN